MADFSLKDFDSLVSKFAGNAIEAFILIKSHKVDCYKDILCCKDYSDYSTYFRLNRMEQYKIKLTPEEFLFLKRVLTEKVK